jgi:hypothetical protein
VGANKKVSIPTELQGLIAEKEFDSQEKMVNNLLDTKENIETKTDLTKPIRWACLTVIEEFLRKFDLAYSSEILKLFTNLSFRYLISKDRKSRSEYVSAISSLSKPNQLNFNQPTKLMD